MTEFDNLVCEAIGELKGKGHWLESGVMNLENELWSYRFQKLKQKPQKPCKECSLPFTSEKFDLCYNCRPKKTKTQNGSTKT